MHRLFITSIIWLSPVLSALGSGTEFPITTTNLDQYKYLFSVSTNAATNGVACHVTITAKKEDIAADSTADLSIVTRTTTRGGAVTGGIAAVKPEIHVTLKRDKRVWEADFTVSYELLERPGLCFVFSTIDHETIGGKTVAIGGAVDYYEIKLRDFLKQ